MLLAVIMFVALAALLIVMFAKPKWGSYLIWFLLFAYPHYWWFYKGFLPLNIGADDLFCILLFLVVLIRRNIIDGVPIRFGYAFWIITSFVFIAIVASISGYSYASRAELSLHIKEILKFGINWCLFYAILHCIDNERDLRMQFTMFSLAAAVGGILVILSYFFPYVTEPFSNPLRDPEYAGRAYGAFLNANAAAAILTCLLIFTVTTIKLQQRFISKILMYTFIAISLLGIIMTKSRAGLLALVGSFGLMAIFGRTKKIAWLVIITAVIITLSATDIRELYKERIIRAYSLETGQFGGGVVSRFHIWRMYFETATPQIYIFGQGKHQGMVRNAGASSHSGYVGLITVYGIGGVIWALLGLTIFLRKVFALRRFPDPVLSTVAAGCFWALIAWGIYITSAGGLGAGFQRTLLFYFVVLLDRSHFLARQEQAALPTYAEEVDYVEIPTQMVGTEY